MYKNKEYTGSVYVGIVGSELENSVCQNSIERVQLRQRDEKNDIRATKGFEARSMHVENFLTGKHDFIFFMDHDQTFPQDILERLRSHKMPYVSGFYMRRSFNNMLPVWYEYGPKNKWPMKPWSGVPERGKLHKLGASGWGCMLVHRAVFEAMDNILKGEAYIIEDDMDIWPYDLQKIMEAINGLDSLANEKPVEQNLYASIEKHVETLKNEIVPLRVLKSNVGSDIRFPFFAREAGFDLYGDPDAQCGHMINYPLGIDDYNVNPDIQKRMSDHINKSIQPERRKIESLRKELKK